MRTTNGLSPSPTWSVFTEGLYGAWVSSVAVDQGTCTQSGADVSCAIGTMTPGQEVIFSLVVTGPGDLIYDE